MKYGRENFGVQQVIVDRLTKSSHFIPINISFPMSKLAEIYISVIVKLHGVPYALCQMRSKIYF